MILGAAALTGRKHILLVDISSEDYTQKLCGATVLQP
jgi:hypothetical protein